MLDPTIHSCLPVLNFHDIGTTRTPGQFPTQLFKRCLSILHESGYQTVDLPTFINALNTDTPLPENPIAITFDDGYRSVYQTAFPLMLEVGFRASLFVITGSGGSRRQRRLPPFEGREMLSWSEIRELHQAGFSIGSHTMTHPDLTQIARARVEEELTGSRQLLEDRLGIAINSCAYPYGRHDEQTRSVADKYYSCACSDRLGLVNASSDRLALERIDMCFFDRQPLLQLLTGPLLVPYLSLQRRRLALARRLFGHPGPALA